MERQEGKDGRVKRKEAIEGCKSFRWNREYPRNLPLETVELADARDSDGKRKPFRYRWMVPVLFWDAGRREGERSGRAAERALIARELIKL